MSLNIPKPYYTPPMPKVKPAMSNYELKPCPFCGGRAEIVIGITSVSINANSPAVLVQCKGCYAEMHKIINPYTDYTSLERKAKELAEKWNRRGEQ